MAERNGKIFKGFWADQKLYKKFIDSIDKRNKKIAPAKMAVGAVHEELLKEHIEKWKG